MVHYKMGVDINGLNQIQDVLSNNKESFAVTLCLIDDGVIITDVEGRIVLINGMAETLTGWNAEEAINKPLDEVLHIINKDMGGAKLISRDGKEHEIINKRAPVYNKYGNIMGFVLVFYDATKSEFLKGQEFDNIGITASEIVHKFNNILTIIMGNISLAKKQANQSDKIYEKLMEVENASKQAKILMQRLQNSYKGNLEKRAIGI